MQKLKKEDIVQVIKGKDRGKKGKILSLFAENKRVLVEGINLAKKHKRQTRQDQQGGIVSIEMPISIAKLMLICKHCNRPVRVALVISKDGVKARVCKACKEVI
ncbi:MAG: 50S ribosomal protein L24 [Candidatus Omnitrophica bacterium]|nr:50S ribosomal protein L24 [Candidatus Omnitrophota bacterium]